MASLTQRATTATLWSTLEIGSRYAAQFVVSIVLARLLTPADFGLIAMLLVFTSIGALLVDSGFGTALIQRRQITSDDETTVFVFAVTSGIIVSVLIWLSAPAIAGFYHQPRLVGLTHLVVLVIPIGALAAVPDALLTRRLGFAKRARAELIASGCAGLVAIALAWRGFGVWSMAWQVVVAMSIRCTLLWRFARWWPRGRFTSTSFRHLFDFGGFILMAQILDVTFVRMQSLLLGRLFDARTLGYYSLAQNTQQAPASFMGTVLNRVGLPVFSEISDQPAKLRSALQLTLRASLFLFLPCMLGLALLAKPLVILVFGKPWVDAAPILSLLALSSALWPLHVLNISALTSTGRSDVFFRLEVIKKVISIAMVIAVSPAGPMAIAGALLVSSAIGAYINTRPSSRMFDYGLLAQLMDQKLTFVMCAASAATGWLMLKFGPAGLAGMLVSILAAAVVYIGGAFALRSKAMRELIDMARLLLPQGRAGESNGPS